MFTDILDYQYLNKTRRNISLNRLDIITVTKYNHNNVTVTIQNIACMQTSMDQNDKSWILQDLNKLSSIIYVA